MLSDRVEHSSAEARVEEMKGGSVGVFELIQKDRARTHTPASRRRRNPSGLSGIQKQVFWYHQPRGIFVNGKIPLAPRGTPCLHQPSQFEQIVDLKISDLPFCTLLKPVADKNIVGLQVGVSSTKKVCPARLAWY
jgi:hypothetical protein